MDEPPFYVLKQSLSRALIPKIITLAFLSIIFYLGILLNLSLLALGRPEQEKILWSAGEFLLLFNLLGFLLAWHRAKSPYQFFRDRIVFQKTFITYPSIINTQPHQNGMDRLFHTSTFLLNSTFALRHIPQNPEISTYLQQLIAYARNSR